MVLLVAYFNNKISFFSLIKNWSIVFIGNLASCIACTWLFGYASQLFTEPNYTSLAVSTAEKKTGLDFEVILIRAIPANALICICIHIGALARDISGKMIGMHLPISK